MENNTKGVQQRSDEAAKQQGQQSGFPGMLSGTQFNQFLKEHRRAIIYAAVTQNVVQPGTTATPKNLSRIRDLAEAILELM